VGGQQAGLQASGTVKQASGPGCPASYRMVEEADAGVSKQVQG